MKNSTTVKTYQHGNVIILDRPHPARTAKPHRAKDSVAVSHRPHGRWVTSDCDVVDSDQTHSKHLARGHTDPDFRKIPVADLKRQYPREFQSFRAMKYNRCGKGQQFICHPDIGTFQGFLSAFGPSPDPSYTLDRKDPTDIEYAPGKCVWASKRRQAENKAVVRYLESSDGIRLSIPEWSRRTGIPRKTIHERINRGWIESDAVQVPVGGRRSSPRSTSTSRRSLFPDHPPAHLQALLDTWTRLLRDQHEKPVFLLEWKHFPALEYIYQGLVRCDAPPEQVLECILETPSRWRDYAGCDAKPPRTPDLHFLKRNLMEAAIYYLNRGGIRLREHLPDQQSGPALPGEFEGQL